MRLSTSLRLNAQKGLVTPYDPALTLDLQFAARQAYVANIGPLPTFTNLTTTARTFVGSDGLIQTAATNVPRIDFDPVTRLCRGLLIEEQRTNLLTYSEDFSNAAWSKVNATVTANASVAPDGTTTADKLIANTTLDQHRCDQTPSSTAVAQTFSVYVKAAGYGFVGLRLNATGALFDLSTGGINIISAGITAQSTYFGNGWYRCSITKATGVANDVCRINISDGSGIASNFTGNGTDGIFLWGAQLEAGAFATSYIPTTTGSLVRSADFCSITGAAFTGFYNQTEGTLVFKGMKPAVQANGTTYISVDDNTVNERLILYYSANEFLNVQDGGVSQAIVSSGFSAAANTRFGMAAR